MNEDNFFDSLKIWYEHYHDLKEGKDTYKDVKIVTELAQSIIEQMHTNWADVCEKLDLPAGTNVTDVLNEIKKLKTRKHRFENV